MRVNTCGRGNGEGVGEGRRNSHTVMAVWPPVKEGGRECWVEASGTAVEPEKFATRPLGSDVGPYPGRVSQQRSFMAPRNGQVLVSLPDSATGWEQPMRNAHDLDETQCGLVWGFQRVAGALGQLHSLEMEVCKGYSHGHFHSHHKIKVSQRDDLQFPGHDL